MAYPTVSAPYGLKPVNLIGGQVFAGATRQMEIASGYATSIFFGDLVKRISDGTIQKDTGTTTATPWIEHDRQVNPWIQSRDNLGVHNELANDDNDSDDGIC